MRRSVSSSILIAVLCMLGTSWAGSPNGAAPSATATPDPTPAIATPAVMDNLLNLMVSKGVLTTAEAVQLRGLPAGQQITPLLSILAKKGVLTQDDLAALNVGSPAPAYSSSVTVIASNVGVTGTGTAESANVGPASPPAQPPPQPAAPTVVTAVAPLRVLPVDQPKREGLIPDLKVGPVRLKPYGFIKASLINDT